MGICYNLSEEDVLNLMSIKGGLISDLVESQDLDSNEKVKKIHELGGEIAELNEILGHYASQPTPIEDETA